MCHHIFLKEKPEWKRARIIDFSTRNHSLASGLLAANWKWNWPINGFQITAQKNKIAAFIRSARLELKIISERKSNRPPIENLPLVANSVLVGDRPEDHIYRVRGQ